MRREGRKWNGRDRRRKVNSGLSGCGVCCPCLVDDVRKYAQQQTSTQNVYTLQQVCQLDRAVHA